MHLQFLRAVYLFCFGYQLTNEEELFTWNETETEQPGQQGLSFGTFRQAHHEQMEEKAEDWEEQNSELFQLEQDGFDRRKQKHGNKMCQFSEEIKCDSQKPGKLSFF